jgi:hypothetical protein
VPMSEVWGAVGFSAVTAGRSLFEGLGVDIKKKRYLGNFSGGSKINPIKTKVRWTTMTIMTLVKALNQLYFVLSLILISYSRQVQVISPSIRSSIHGFSPVLLPSYRQDNTTFGPISDTC